MRGGGGTSAAHYRREMREREEFLTFARVLIKYLEQKNDGKRMHARAMGVIKECARRHKRREPGYENVIESMRLRLKEVVGDRDWWKVNNCLVRFVVSKQATAA